VKNEKLAIETRYSKEDFAVGLNRHLQKIVDILAAEGFEVMGIGMEGYADPDVNRVMYNVKVARAVPKSRSRHRQS